MPAKSTIEKALDALDGMATIVKAEQLTVGNYEAPCADENAPALCQGHKFCAIGSLWIGGGVGLNENGRLPGAWQDDRAEFLRPRHGLRLAYEELNASAERFMKRKGIDREDLDMGLDAPIEALFESEWAWALDRTGLLSIINSAKRSLRAKAATS